MVDLEDVPLLPVKWNLKPTGRRLLTALLRKGRITRDQAARIASPYGGRVDDSVVNAQMYYLRKRLEAAMVGGHVRVETVHGWGYALENLEDARACVREHGGSWE